MKLEIEVGKSYVRRDGEVVKIVGNSGHRYPFNSDRNNGYTKQGAFSSLNKNHSLDLVSEYTEPTRDSANDGWVKEARLTEAEARIKELEDANQFLKANREQFIDAEVQRRAELDTLKPKSVTKSRWVNVYGDRDNVACSSRAGCDARAGNTRLRRVYVLRTDTTTHPDGSVTVTNHKEEI